MADAVDQALVALDAASEALEAIRREMAFDPRELEQTEERLFALRAAARKHQVEADALTEVLAKYEGDIEALESGAETLVALEAELRDAGAAYHEAAEKLSKARERAAKALSKAVEAELPDLKLGAAKFIVDRQVDQERVSPHGIDQIAFHVQTNPGTTPGPMMKVASGGELSRFLLALKVVLADKGSVQVLTVTHAPQVAARAQTHLLIEKQAIEEGAFMRTHVRPLDTGMRGEEVARMLAGATITEEARAAAQRLMREVGV